MRNELERLVWEVEFNRNSIKVQKQIREGNRFTKARVERLEAELEEFLLNQAEENRKGL